MKLNIAIVDDQERDSEQLQMDLCNWHCPDGVELGSILRCPSGKALLTSFEPKMIQLVFMDICMDKLNGIETAKRLRSIDTEVLIVFVTTSREFAFEAFPVHPFDYIVKPYKKDRLESVLNEAVRVLTNNEPEITIHVSRGQQHTLPLHSISAVMAQGHGVEVSLKDGQCFMSTQSFSEIEPLLMEHSRFLLCNRGLIVNMDQVAVTDEEAFRMKNGRVYPIRVRGRMEVMAAFSQYQISRLRGVMKIKEAE